MDRNFPISFLMEVDGRLTRFTPGLGFEVIDDPQLVQALRQMDVEALVPNPLENFAAYYGPLPQIQAHAPLAPLQQPPPPQVQVQPPPLEVDDDPIRDISKLFEEGDAGAPPLDMADHANNLAEAVGDSK